MLTPHRAAVIAAAAAIGLTAALLAGGSGLHCQETSDYFPGRSDKPASATPQAALASWLDADGEEAPKDGWEEEAVERGRARFHNGPWEVAVVRVPSGGFTVATTTCTGFLP